MQIIFLRKYLDKTVFIILIQNFKGYVHEQFKLQVSVLIITNEQVVLVQSIYFYFFKLERSQ